MSVTVAFYCPIIVVEPRKKPKRADNELPHIREEVDDCERADICYDRQALLMDIRHTGRLLTIHKAYCLGCGPLSVW